MLLMIENSFVIISLSASITKDNKYWILWISFVVIFLCLYKIKSIPSHERVWPVDLLQWTSSMCPYWIDLNFAKRGFFRERIQFREGTFYVRSVLKIKAFPIFLCQKGQFYCFLALSICLWRLFILGWIFIVIIISVFWIPWNFGQVSATPKNWLFVISDPNELVFTDESHS